MFAQKVLEQARVNKDDAARQAGFKHYDCALPQQWLDNIANLAYKAVQEMPTVFREGISRDDIYQEVLYGTVWSYDNQGIFGEAAYITEEAYNWVLLSRIARDRLNHH